MQIRAFSNLLARMNLSHPDGKVGGRGRVHSSLEVIMALKMKVGEKGGLSVYGLQRFPITLYKEQWEALLSGENVTAILSFIAAHPELKVRE